MESAPFILEIACFSMESALIAENAGADRIELCDNPMEGGTTPSYGTLKIAITQLKIPIHPIIRPRGGHFVYTVTEIEIMKEDIRLCKNLGYEGVVFGLLQKDGSINSELTEALVELAYPMEVTFHRAFDRCKDPFAALETLIACGCTRVLTSGQQPDVNNASTFIRQLIDKSEHRIGILPGSGIKSDRFEKLIEETQVNEYHASARVLLEEPYFVPESMEETLYQTLVSEQEVQALKSVMKTFYKTSRGS